MGMLETLGKCPGVGDDPSSTALFMTAMPGFCNCEAKQSCIAGSLSMMGRADARLDHR